MRALAALLLATASASAASAPPKTPAAERLDQQLEACTPCHGAQDRTGADAYYPRIAGKPDTYLYNQLLNFRDGRRHYAPMTELVSLLSDDYLREIARHFARLDLPHVAPRRPVVPAATLERGRKLALDGDPGREIPGCARCHGERLEGRPPAVPGLVGLPRDYINAQLGAWKTGLRSTRPPDCMATIAGRLTPDDVSALSAWIASRSFEAAPAGARTRTAMPMPCGSVDPSAAETRTEAAR